MRPKEQQPRMATVDTPKTASRPQRQPEPQPDQKPKSVWARLADRWRDVVAEIRKITWPTREETRNLTVVVIGISAVVGIALSVVDTILSFLVSQIGR